MHLHLISFDVPYPANYGGVIDVYYKLRALHNQGQRVHLHCFDYGRGVREELELLCEKIYYYPRKPILRSLPVKYPHIVSSRGVDTLLKNLLQDHAPILFEGLHTTYFLSHPELETRLKLVRIHNIEWEYYFQLSQREDRYWYRQYYQAESRLLRTWEDILSYADHLLTISPKDTDYYTSKHPSVHYLPAFHAHGRVSSRTGKGEYALYHGKLSVAENHEAAMFLIYEVFADLPYPLFIAGGEPKPALIEAINQFEHILLHPNPGEAEMADLLQHAHVHVLPTFQATGIKLKLINSLFAGRFVVVNPPMINQTGLEFSTTVAHEPAAWHRVLNDLFRQEFTEIDLAQRKASLSKHFNTARNAEKIVALLQQG
ncbi:MAG: hypothetical protein AAFV07_10125 [Bacteroidota bacterium]